MTRLALEDHKYEAIKAHILIFKTKFNPDKMLLVEIGDILYEEFLKINPKELF